MSDDLTWEEVAAKIAAGHALVMTTPDKWLARLAEESPAPDDDEGQLEPPR